MTHTITEEELGDWIEKKRQEWMRFAGSCDRDSRKAIELKIGNVAPIYRVIDHGRDIYIGSLKETAVREYNALP